MPQASAQAAADRASRNARRGGGASHTYRSGVLGEIERGWNAPSNSTAKRIAEALGAHAQPACSGHRAFTGSPSRFVSLSAPGTVSGRDKTLRGADGHGSENLRVIACGTQAADHFRISRTRCSNVDTSSGSIEYEERVVVCVEHPSFTVCRHHDELEVPHVSGHLDEFWREPQKCSGGRLRFVRYEKNEHSPLPNRLKNARQAVLVAVVNSCCGHS